MTDQVQQMNAEQAPSLSPEQFDSIKRSLTETLHKNYSQFISSIAHFPCAPHIMQVSFQHFDTGFLWFEKAIQNMPVPQVQVTQAPQPQAPSEQAGAPTNEEAPQAPNENPQVELEPRPAA